VAEVALNSAFVLTATVKKMPDNIAAVGMEVDFNEVCRSNFVVVFCLTLFDFV
jgi:hypothetical protein